MDINQEITIILSLSSVLTAIIICVIQIYFNHKIQKDNKKHSVELLSQQLATTFLDKYFEFQSQRIRNKTSYREMLYRITSYLAILENFYSKNNNENISKIYSLLLYLSIKIKTSEISSDTREKISKKMLFMIYNYISIPFLNYEKINLELKDDFKININEKFNPELKANNIFKNWILEF